jgi:hypothetical protein
MVVAMAGCGSTDGVSRDGVLEGRTIIYARSSDGSVEKSISPSSDHINKNSIQDSQEILEAEYNIRQMYEQYRDAMAAGDFATGYTMLAVRLKLDSGITGPEEFEKLSPDERRRIMLFHESADVRSVALDPVKGRATVRLKTVYGPRLLEVIEERGQWKIASDYF